MTSIHLIEIQAGERYTRRLFSIFQKEWTNNHESSHDTLSKEIVQMYLVSQYNEKKYRWKKLNTLLGIIMCGFTVHVRNLSRWVYCANLHYT